MTLRIYVLKSGKPIDQFDMETDRVTIGRRAECDIPVKDPAISGAHAEIEFVGNGYILRDLGSTNGVSVKGKQVKEYVIKDGDLIDIGEHQLKIKVPDSKAPPKKAAPRTPELGGERDKTQVRAVPVTSQTDGYLKFMKGGKPGEIVKLEEAMTSIGVPGIQMAAVSKRPQGHFIIHVEGGKENKTPIVNGEPIGFKSRKLAAGDLIEVGGLELEYCFD